MSGEETKKSLFKKLFEEIIWLDSNYIHPIFCKWIINEMPLGKADKVIDIGCGTGWLSREIAKIVIEGEVVGLDISEEFIKRAKQVTEKDKSDNYKNLVFMVTNVENIPYPNDYFNYAVSIVSFSWWDDPEKALEEIKRVLKPSGSLYLADASKESLISSIPIKIWNLLSPNKENLYSSKEYREFFERAGFTDVFQKKWKGMLLTTIGTKKQVAPSPTAYNSG